MSHAPQVGSARSDSTRVVKVNRRKTNRRKTRPYCISYILMTSAKKSRALSEGGNTIHLKRRGGGTKFITLDYPKLCPLFLLVKEGWRHGNVAGSTLQGSVPTHRAQLNPITLATTRQRLFGLLMTAACGNAYKTA